MSDNRRQYRAIKHAVKQLYPEEPTGQVARHLETLVFLISGIIASKSCQLPQVASQVPGTVHPDSRVKQLSRWTQNERVTTELYFLPFVRPLLERLAAVRPLVLVMDGSAVARGCVTLMVSVLYAHRAIPIGWLVISGAKGHFPTTSHLALLHEVHALIPTTAEVIFLGDGEFDSPELLQAIAACGWQYVCRTAKNSQFRAAGDPWASLETLAVTRGQRAFQKAVEFTLAAYGPVMVIAWWGARSQAPLYLVSNLASVQRAFDYYRQRMRIETFFSDQKSRGFHLAHSHLSDPARVHRLLIAACLAYLWVVCLGTVAQADGWQPKIHRQSRCDLSLFQLGLRLLAHLLTQDKPIPSSFALEPESVR